MNHLSRLDHALHRLLHTQRVAALGTLGPDGAPLVSMVPFAIEPRACVLVVHVSALAAHTGNMVRNPAVSLLVMQSEAPDQPVHALPRVTVQGRAESLDKGGASWQAAREVYLARFPDAGPMMQLGDFRLVVVQPAQARHVAGFGAARTVEGDQLVRLLAERWDAELAGEE